MKNSTHEITRSFVDSYIKEVKLAIKQLDKGKITLIVEAINKAYKENKRIYILGNGGSASIASHIACDLGKGTLSRMYNQNEKRIRVISLTDNTALISAYANDVGYDSIFIQQLQNLLEENDVVILISGSGNSSNILKAVKYARKVGAVTVGLTGFKTGGKLSKLVDIDLIIQSNHYGPIEDIHLMIGHILTACMAQIKSKETKNDSKNNSVPFKK